MIDRIRRGRDPVPTAQEEPTAADLVERFMTGHVEVNCKPGTVESYGSLLRMHILPELGALRLSESVEACLYRDCPEPTAAG